VGVATAAVCLRASVQEPARQVFRSAVDLVTIMVYVVDADGRPVPGLAPEDFTVELDGQRRPVRALDYRETTVAAAADGPAVTAVTADGGLSGGGRVITVLVDDLSFRTSSIDLPAIRAAVQRMTAALSPRDRIGLVTTSGRGPAISPTTDHQRVAAAIQAVNGRATQDSVVGVYVSLIEAIEVLRDGPRSAAFDEVASRECRVQNIDVIEVCRAIIDGQARVVLDETRDRTALQIRAYQSVLASLSGEPRPRLLVLVSDGLATGTGVGFTADLARVSRAAAEANVQLYAVVSEGDNAMINEGNRQRVAARSAEVALLHDGIESVTGAVGGALLRLVGSADRPFERMLSESSGVYEIGVDAPPGGRARLPEVVVSVSRPGVVVRANRRALVPTVAVARPSADAEVRRVLAEGATVVGVPLSVAATSRRAPGSRDLQLAVDLGVPDSAIAPLDVAFAVVSDQGRTVTSGTGRIDGAPRDGEYKFAFTVPLPAGRYGLRVAVADPDGRVGGVEHPVALDLLPMGRLLASDLQTGWLDEHGTRRFLGLARLPASAVAADISLELYPADDTRPDGSVAVQVDVAEVGSPSPASTAVFSPTIVRDRWQLRTSIPVDNLSPGLFTVTATVLDGGVAVGTRTTTLEKVSAPEDAAAAREELPPRAAVLEALFNELRGVRRPFNLAPLVGSDDVRAAVRSVAASAGEVVPDGLASDESPAALWDALGTVAREARTALGAFARGLLNLRLPNGPAAAAQFELALERAPASTAALRYLGAAYAASGQDQEAAGAWQLALADPAATRAWHLAQADALVRIGDRRSAAEVLRALLAQAPGESDVLVRLIEVQLADGRTDEAVPLVGQLVAASPDDVDARWWQVVLAFADAVDPDRPAAVERFVTLADRYLERNGPRAELVRAWVRAVRRESR
jgi:VWFA-related protein